MYTKSMSVYLMEPEPWQRCHFLELICLPKQCLMLQVNTPPQEEATPHSRPASHSNPRISIREAYSHLDLYCRATSCLHALEQLGTFSTFLEQHLFHSP